MKFWCTVVIAVLLLALGFGPGEAAAETPEPTPPAESGNGGEGAEGTAEEPPANTLRWTTASEVDNFGFDIYRALVEDGPFDRITAEPLPGAGTTDEPQNYVFVDVDIDPTRDYFYYIESISLGGVREKFSPVIRAPAKRPGEGKD
ncbi:MAG: hypothetical protein MUC56_06550 [Thermoanaerobaculales bacterium]|jgi:hypothetical protein|nr:hypothetical protein [Thermoanaerobaculales bacterium]